jgi:phage anti-repressor protein
MNDLIRISSSTIGGSDVQSVNARELHTFLEVGKAFAAWIRERIDQYQFAAGIDYEVFSETGNNPSGGRPTTEYAISLDMAKELAMVERNAKGKQARQYFIECERRAKSPPANSLPIMRDAIELFQPFFQVAILIGCDKQAAAISANQAVFAVSGANVLQLMGRTHMEAENQESLFYIPRELGERLGGISAQKVNKMLAASGFQAKVGDQWEVTEAGKRFARIYDTGKKHSSGVPVQQIKWSAEVIPALGRDAA